MFVTSNTFHFFILLCSCNVIIAKNPFARRVERSPQTSSQSGNTSDYQNQGNDQAQDAPRHPDGVTEYQDPISDQDNQFQKEGNDQMESGQGINPQNHDETDLSDVQNGGIEQSEQAHEVQSQGSNDQSGGDEMIDEQTGQSNEYQDQIYSNSNQGQAQTKEDANQYSNQNTEKPEQVSQTENIDIQESEAVDRVGNSQEKYPQVEEPSNEDTENMAQTENGQANQGLTNINTSTVSNSGRRRRTVKYFFRRMN